MIRKVYLFCAFILYSLILTFGISYIQHCTQSTIENKPLDLPSLEDRILARKNASQKDIASLIPVLETYYLEPIMITTTVQKKEELHATIKEWILLFNNEYNKHTLKIPFFGAKDTNSPYLQYKKIIETDILAIKKALKSAFKQSKDAHLAYKDRAKRLIEQLNALDKTIIITDEYHNELILKSASSKSSIITSLITHGIIFGAKKALFGIFF